MREIDIMAAKTIVITGGTSGIGLAGALELARQGHRIVLVARVLNAELAALVASAQVERLATVFEPAQVLGCRLVIAATDERETNRAVAAAAVALGHRRRPQATHVCRRPGWRGCPGSRWRDLQAA